MNFNPLANQDDGSCFVHGHLDQGVDDSVVLAAPVLLLGDRRDGAPAGYSIADHTVMFERPIATPNGACYEVAKSLLGPWHIVNLADNWIIDGSGYGNAVYYSDTLGNKPYDTLYKLDSVDCTTADISSNVNPNAPPGGDVGGIPGGSGSDVGMVFLIILGFLIIAVFATNSRAWTGASPTNIPSKIEDVDELDAREEEARQWLSSIQSKKESRPNEEPTPAASNPPLEPIFLGWLDGANEGDLAPSDGADKMSED